MKDVNLKLVKMEDIKFNDDLFIPIKTKTIVDTILSTEGGIFPGTNTVIIGDPGVGKSTVLLDWLADFQKQGKKVLFVSGEMNEIDLYGYVKRFPKFAKLPIMFMGDYSDCPKEAIEQVFDQGYDAERYIEFSKNRRGGVGEKIYFSLSRGGKVDYSFENVTDD